MANLSAADFVADVRTWEGVKFRHQGRSRLGVDCIGLAVCTLREKGILPQDFADNACYGRAPNTSEFIDTVKKFCTPIAKTENGCLLVFKWPHAKFPSHAAVLDGGCMIHAYEKIGRVVRVSYGQPWLRLTDSIYRLPGISAP
jgi:cell wall-associated NlpC family hydrolase